MGAANAITDELLHSLTGLVNSRFLQVLSVDDEEVNQIVLEEILSTTGYVYAR
jgi:hypothetical protein